MDFFSFLIEEKDAGIRLDKLLTQKLPGKTRNFLQKLFGEKQITVNGKVVKANHKAEIGQKIEVCIPPPKELILKAVPLPLDIVFENKDLLVINKPAGLVTHPGQGETHLEDSLVNAVLYHCKGELSGISGTMRPGIVHRLDKDTSGLLIVAKNDKAHQSLAHQLKERQIEKVYLALVAGKVSPKTGIIDAPIGRSLVNRKKMSVVSENQGKNAITKYEVLEYFKKDFAVEAHYSLVQIRLITGRTHQIRVHFASIGHPLVGDPLYGREKLNTFFAKKSELKRQFLHAKKICFILPGGIKKVCFESELPLDLSRVLEILKE